MANKFKSTHQIRSNDNFLEALRGLGNGTGDEIKKQSVKVITNDIPEMFGVLKPNESISMEQNKPEPKQVVNYLSQERTLFLRQEQENKVQIQAVLQEIKALAKTTSEFAREVEVATFMAPANPGVYHKTFFERLKGFIKMMRLKVAESRNWLAASNSRAKKQQGYWGKVKTSGTKFMLSQERYAVTSTG